MKILLFPKSLFKVLGMLLLGLMYSSDIDSVASDVMEEAITLANSGEFLKASELAAELGGSEGFAFAAASLAASLSPRETAGS